MLMDRSGQKIDNYQLVRLLGRGAFGDVYLGDDLRSKKQVAIKILKSSNASYDMQQFINEIRALMRLRHPHIVPIIEFGIDPIGPFFVMDYAPNGSLYQRHTKGMQVPFTTVIQYVKQIAEALQYAHDDHLIHRDVKPENILIGTKGELLLSDFGIATLTPTSPTKLNQTVSDQATGSPRYMAPEQWQGKPIPATDQYALGIVVYEWLSGECPFGGDEWYQLKNQHLNDEPPPLSNKVPTISPEIETIVMKALAKNPEDRFKSVREFAQSLARAGLSPNDLKIEETVSSINTIPIEGKIPVDNRHQDWDEAPETDVFFGRTKEMNQLKRWIVQEECRLVAIVGIGGIGKSKLSTKLARGIQDDFDYIIWRSLRTDRSVTKILEELIKFLSDQQEVNISSDLDEKISRLLHYLRKNRCLLILDNVDTILQEGQHLDQYRAGHKEYDLLFKRVADAQHQSCLLLTSRERPSSVTWYQKKGPTRLLELTGVDYLAGKRFVSTLVSLSGSKKEWQELNDSYRGNPLALKLVAGLINNIYSKNILAFLSEGRRFFDHHDLREVLDWYFSRLSDEQKEVLYWLAINGDPMTYVDLQEDILSHEANQHVPITLQQLQHLQLLEKSVSLGAPLSYFTLQPVIIEYMIMRFIEQIVNEIETEEIHLFHNHALLKATTRDYIRESQIRIILRPIVELLNESLGENGCKNKLEQLLNALSRTSELKTGYAAGNILNLLIYLNIDLSGCNFSRLTIRQAYLQGASLPNTNFSYANFEKCFFTETFGNVLSAAFSPDGKLLAAGVGAGGKGEIRVIRISDGKLLHICKEPMGAGWVWSVAFSPDGKIIASGYNDGTIHLWDTDSGEITRTIKEHKQVVRSVAFSPDGKIFASGSEDTTVRLWDTHTGQCMKVLSLQTGRIWSVAFSSKGKFFASGSDDGTVCLWKANPTIEDTDQPFKILTLPEKSKVWAIALNAEGSILASGSEDMIVRLWDTESDITTPLKEMTGHTGWVRALNFSPDGSILASSGEEPIIYLWDTNTGHSRRVEGHNGWIRTIHFSPNGETLVSGSDDMSMRLWDVKTTYQLKKWQGYGDSVRSVAFSPDGKLLASAGDDQIVHLWNLETTNNSEILSGHAGQVWSVAFSPDGKLLASGGDDQTVRLWNIETRECINILQGHNNSVRSVAFNLTGDQLASGSLDKTMSRWNWETKQNMKMPHSHTDRVRSIAFSPDGTTIVSGGDDRLVWLWNTKTDTIRRLPGHDNRIQTVAFSPVGSILATAGNDRSIKLWDIENDTLIRTLDQKHLKTIWSIAFNPSGEILASGSDDKTIMLWDVRTGKHRHTLEHSSIVLCIAFSPKENILASGSDDGTVTLWSINGERLRTLKIDKPYKGMNITGVKGLTEDQKLALSVLGVVEDQKS